MKTKIKKYSSFLIAFLAITIGSIAYASYGSSDNQNSCPDANGHGNSTSCVSFHNNGYTGSDGHHGTFKNGTSFATFNGYKDQATHDERHFDERQFLYIESSRASEDGLPNPELWNDNSNYNFDSSTSTDYTINFNGSEPQKIGVWGYMHNNGTKNLYPAENTTIRFSGWNENTPQQVHRPRFTISASNTKPRTVWADVTIRGSEPFTLRPTEAYWIREADQNRESLDIKKLNSKQLPSITSSGARFKSDPNNNSGIFDSSQVHYVKIYLEFEATPQETGACHSLNITDPNEQLLYVDENGFIDKPLSFTVDTDPNVVSGYKVLSTRDSITFDNTGQSNIQTNKTSMVMDGGPDSNNSPDTVQVWALDQNGNGIQACHDSFNVQLEQKTNECKTLETTPAPPGVDYGPVPLNESVKINIDKLVDTNNDPYLDNGAIPQIRYCYTNNGILFSPDSITYAVENNGKCAVTLSTDTMKIIASQKGTMNIEVVGAKQCHDSFETKGETEGQCISLEINQQKFTADDSTYSVDVETDPNGLPYDVEWFVDSTNGNRMSPITESGNSIDLNDYNYNFTPGDTLVARATNIKNPDNVCMDQLTSQEEECTRFTLDRDTFEPGTNQEVCVNSSDWPLYSGDNLEYSVDGEETREVTLNEDRCFVLTDQATENADRIKIWVPGWEDPCYDELKKEVKPPKFSKNVKSNDSSVFSHRTVANFSDTYVDYEITYTHFNTEEQDVEITDTIGVDGYIQGYIAGTTTDINSAPEGGQIYYDDDSMHVFVNGDEIENCEDTDEDLCYEGSIGDANGVTVKNVPNREKVLVKYRGEIRDSAVNPKSCSDPDSDLNQTGVCGEIYPNKAHFKDELDFTGNDEAEVIIPCPFIIIRAGGDVFLENPFDYGVDTLSCSEIRTSDTPVIQGNPPDDRDLVETGEDSSVLKQYDERLCNSSSEGSTDIKGISSLICELELTSKELTQQAIVQNLARNIQLFSRYSKNLNNTDTINGSSSLPESSNNVYIKDNGMLILGGEFANKARTIVVLNNNVYIKKNLTFKDPESLTDPRKVPSLAVIVIGGNIVVDPNVSETNAIFFVQEGEKGGGQICEAPKTGSQKQSKFCVDNPDIVNYNTENRLTHYGSIYGDIEHLLKYRVKTGDPTKEEGAILIRFDNRIYLNTPPLLNKLVDVTQKAF